MPNRLSIDQKLVLRYSKGDESAIQALVIRHKNKIFNCIVCIVKDKNLAKDIFQDTFYKVIISIKKGEYDEKNTFLLWVLRIARNLSIDYCNKAKKMPSTSYIISEKEEEIDIYTALNLQSKPSKNRREQAELKKELFMLIEKLPQKQKEVVIMHHYFDLSFREISELTEVRVNTLLGRMRQGLMRLRKIIKEQKVFFDK